MMERNNVLQIDIVGNRYHLDDTQENLIPVDKDLSIIQTGDLEIAIDHEWERLGYYDLVNRCLYHPPENLYKLPDSVIGFSIPSYQALAEAKHTALVVYAETANLLDTNLALIVAENKIKMSGPKKDGHLGSDQSDSNNTRNQKRQLKKRGRHL